ncbi:MAG TPA: fucose isomerase [Candidatus Aminicenantes bacterium]|nr:fucose isomerase [Candidatus Aminicenantes bacterium]
MTKIALLQLDSGRHDPVAFENDRREFLAPWRGEFAWTDLRPGEPTDADLAVVFIASGGCEQRFRQVYGGLPKPVILLADGKHNSLPAALEISHWVRRQGEAAEIVCGDPGAIVARLNRLAVFQRTRRALAGPIGLIGTPSDWLIASGVNRIAVQKRWGTRFVDIPLTEVTGHSGGEGEASDIAEDYASRAIGLAGVDLADVRTAARLVPALKAVFSRHRLRVATLRCFDLLEPLGTSGCLALSSLCDQELICGCEGDVPGVFSMLLAFVLTGQYPFLANPAAIDTARQEVTLAHCTVPRRAVDGYRLQTHFETGTGVALDGRFSPGPATVFKVGNPDLGSYFVSGAEILPGEPQDGLCRTQVRLRLREGGDYFLRSSLANHHLLIRGDHAEEIDDFMRYYGATRVR